jgi:predicted kinase
MDAQPPVQPAESPTVYLLCGFVAAGKTTYARCLEAQGCVRLSIDEFIFETHGEHGVDYDEGDYPSFESEALSALDDRLVVLLREGRDVVLDYGFWSPEQRDRYKRLVNDAGACWQLLYFQTDLAEIRRRLTERNAHHDANSLVVTDRHLAEFLTRWQPPCNEGELVVEQAD